MRNGMKRGGLVFGFVVSVFALVAVSLAAPFEQLNLNEWTIQGTKVTSSAAELNIMDGVTVSAAQLNAAGGGSTATITPTTITSASGTITSSNITANGTVTAKGAGGVLLSTNCTVLAGQAANRAAMVVNVTASNAPVGSLYLNGAGKLYVKTAMAAATSSWVRVTTDDVE